MEPACSRDGVRPGYIFDVRIVDPSNADENQLRCFRIRDTSGTQSQQTFEQGRLEGQIQVLLWEVRVLTEFPAQPMKQFRRVSNSLVPAPVPASTPTEMIAAFNPRRVAYEAKVPLETTFSVSEAVSALADRTASRQDNKRMESLGPLSPLST